MLLKVADLMINVSHIKYIKVKHELNCVIIYFLNNVKKKIFFSERTALDDFLTKIGRNNYYAD
ncbi:MULTISPECIES: hypothetical protein [unclassified Acinetobacter]|uniref:hypothetical protein n=1 Tax=unclassified Acinetobacter TaxID=196816 RepID=UPI002934E22D|nr:MULTISPECIES: hypothetical protein [unclassified Acinetobacter]WOE32278.1 hypothetical protein QSG84_03450 [Acinetobacter sp. SAAs470]WOE37749.1 hypothetical protein QSG86_12495 [Acinetobacter sp. SAAs474]